MFNNVISGQTFLVRSCTANQTGPREGPLWNFPWARAECFFFRLARADCRACILVPFSIFQEHKRCFFWRSELSCLSRCCNDNWPLLSLSRALTRRPVSRFFFAWCKSGGAESSSTNRRLPLHQLRERAKLTNLHAAAQPLPLHQLSAPLGPGGLRPHRLRLHATGILL